MNRFKWMTLPILAAGALGACFAFGGCTVTSGTVDNPEGGTTTPPPPPPPPSSGDDGGGDAGGACSGNDENQANRTDFGAACQGCLDNSCCTELKNCFNLQVPAGKDDCNKYVQCIVSFCNGSFAADAGNDAGAIADCYKECEAATTPEVVNAYGIETQPNTILGCAKTNCSSSCKF